LERLHAPTVSELSRKQRSMQFHDQWERNILCRWLGSLICSQYGLVLSRIISSLRNRRKAKKGSRKGVPGRDIAQVIQAHDAETH